MTRKDSASTPPAKPQSTDTGRGKSSFNTEIPEEQVVVEKTPEKILEETAPEEDVPTSDHDMQTVEEFDTTVGDASEDESPPHPGLHVAPQGGDIEMEVVVEDDPENGAARDGDNQSKRTEVEHTSTRNTPPAPDRDSSQSSSTTSGATSEAPSLGSLLTKIKTKILDVDLFKVLEENSLAQIGLKKLLKQVNVLETSAEIGSFVMELMTLIDLATADLHRLTDLTAQISSKSETQTTEWDAVSTSTDKVSKLQKLSETYVEEVAACNDNIQKWKTQIAALQEKISQEEKRKQRENPPVFKGKHDPDAALGWLKEIERIFRVMDCTPAQKVRYGTHMLAVEADDWEFMRKYYPEDVRGKKEIEFLELKQGNMSVTDYAAKFVELSKFYPHYTGAGAEFSKCIKFENELRSEIKKAVGYQKIRIFTELVDSCRIFEEDNNAHYKIVSDRRGKQHQNRGKPYDAPVGKGKQGAAPAQRTSRGGDPAGIVCFKCGQAGHKSNVCTAEVKRCFRCGKTGHAIADCKHKEMICFNYGEEGHIGSQCQKPKKSQTGKVFALTGTQTSSEDRLIRGTCFINGTPLITIIDTGATHCFISANCARRLGLKLSALDGELIVETPAKGSTTTSLVCLSCPLSIFDKDFYVDLVCLPLDGMDVILGMNWLEYNYVHINCHHKSVRFSTPEEEGVDLLPFKELRKLMKEGAQMFSLMATLSVESKAKIEELLVVKEFPEVFPDEIPSVPPEREVEFTIDLVPGTRPVSMAPYRMSASELYELKKQLEDL
ncbi:uncharacterized protein LOC127112107, partial [Lathyrus oleraceus]|uniref:uncharacterized protein LOC127112107 n=1 Tax=Pisum sativum TaxID=3888 RepID=UPI0021CE54D1